MPQDQGQIGGKLLLIDDDKEILSLFGKLLTMEGYNVQAVDSGGKGLELFRNSDDYDLVITDLRIGDISGLDVLKSIKACDPLTPVIILTGHASTETAMEAVRLGASDYLVKPVRSPDLVKAVRTQVSNVQLAREVQRLHLEIAEERDKLKKSVAELDLLKRLAERMATVVSHVGGFEAIMNLLVEEVNADIAVIFDFERGTARLNHSGRLYKEDLDRLSESIRERSKSLLGKEIDCSADSFEGLDEDLPTAQEGDFKSTISVPLAFGDKPIGLLVAVSRSDSEYEAEWSEFVLQLSRSSSEFLSGIQRSAAHKRHFTASVVEHTLDGLAVLSPSTGTVLINPVMRTMLDLPSGTLPSADEVEDLFGFNLKEIWDELQAAESDDPTDRIRKMHVEHVHHGKRMFTHVTISVLPEDEYEDGSLLVVAHDVTRERAVEEMKNRLISNITHEVRTPTAVIKEFMSLILDGVSGPITDGQRQYMQIMYSNIERLSRLIENLLTLARSDTGGFTIVLKPIELPGIVQSVAESMEVKLRRKNINLKVEIPEGSPLIYADPDAITQILTNLIDNAYKYSPNDTEVTVRIEDRGNRVILSVADQGYGIPEEKFDAIFDRFQRLVDEDDSRFQEGVGLGLSLVKDMVIRHGGDIWLVSKEGEGSTFFVSLHVASEDKEHQPA